jgi:hypothetical protein
MTLRAQPGFVDLCGLSGDDCRELETVFHLYQLSIFVVIQRT